MSNFVFDSFTGTNGTPLASHVGETGGTWTIHPNWATSDIRIGTANEIYAFGTDVSVYYASGVPGSADYTVEVKLKVLSNLNPTLAGPVARIDPSQNTFYYVAIDGGNNWELRKIVNGSSGLLGSFSQTLTPGQTYSIKLVLSGSSLSVLVDETQIIAATDSSITSAGRAGVLLYKGTTTTGHHLDAITASIKDIYIAFDGDSLTFSQFCSQGGGTVTGTSYPGRVIALLGETSTGGNFGVPGQQVFEMAADAGTQIDPTYSASRVIDAVVMLGGTCDINAGANVATVQSRIQAYWNARRAATPARLLIACTIPRASLTASALNDPVGFDVKRKLVNAWIRSNYSSFADRLVDLDAVPFLSNPDNLVYYQPDGCHFTDAGYAAEAAAVYQTIEGAITSLGKVVRIPGGFGFGF